MLSCFSSCWREAWPVRTYKWVCGWFGCHLQGCRHRRFDLWDEENMDGNVRGDVRKESVGTA